jgi:adenosine 3'-phospho 5'-phosphosulfate transporter B2
MAWNLVTRTRAYSRQDYVSAATVTAGCALFVLGGDITAPGAAGRAGAGAAGVLGSTTGLGLALLAAFMVFDGLTSTSQDSLFANYDMHPCSQLLYTAAWSAALSAGFLLASGQLAGALAFVGRHPASMWLILGQSAVSTAVQVFIVFTIKRYGALNFALMMTVRQYFSIVLSCLVFGHELRGAQWAGTLAVVAGLAVRALDRSRGAGPKALRELAAAGDAGEAELLLAAAAGRPGGKGAIPVLIAASPRAATPGLHARALHAQGSGDFRERVEKLEKAF